MKIAIILGTRPEIIKLFSIIKLLHGSKHDCIIIHTNQHYSPEMDAIFWKELELPAADYNLKIGSGNHGEMTGRMMIAIEKVLMKEKADIVFVQGDTNTVLAGALVAVKLGIKVAHVEAGLRSYDRTMPEEYNRIIADHVGSFLFAPTKRQMEILCQEGIDNSQIFVTGNTIVDAILHFSKKVNDDLLKMYGVKKNEYFLLTLHRPSNVDNQENLEQLLNNISKLANLYNKKVIFPAHPRTIKNIQKYEICPPKNIHIIEPVGYKDLITLQKFADIILTDSGGIQEEACCLAVPCLVLRDNTERPEVIDVGAGKIVGSNYELMLKAYQEFNINQSNRNWINPFGDGKSAYRIIQIIENSVS